MALRTLRCPVLISVWNLASFFLPDILNVMLEILVRYQLLLKLESSILTDLSADSSALNYHVLLILYALFYWIFFLCRSLSSV